jgi:hypothetical protein
MSVAAIWLGSTALSAKLSVASWMSALMLLGCDPRRSAIIWQMFSILLAMSAAIASSLEGSLLVVWGWRGAALLAAMTFVVQTRRWLQANPGQLYAEAACVDPPLKKSKLKQRIAPKSAAPEASRSRPGWLPASLVQTLQLSGCVFSVGLLAATIYSALPGSFLWRCIAVGHTLGSAAALGVMIACAIELTFISSPTATSIVQWQRMAWVALSCWGISLLCVMGVLFWPQQSREFSTTAIVILYSISMMVVNYIGWIIPNRLASFQKKGTITDWITFTMAAWICVLSLAVVAALPYNWPWTASG